MADLLAVNEKIVRAKQHFATYTDEMFAYLKICEHSFSPKINHQEATAVLSYAVTPAPPVRLSILIGDVVYNVRSALDQLVCCIVRTSKPTSSCAGRQFPICLNADDWPTALQSLRGLSKEAKTVIHGLQPCAKPTSAQRHPLSILNALSNRDKHRAPVLTVARSLNSVVTFSDGGNQTRLRVPAPLKAKAGVIFTRIPAWVKQGVRVQVNGTSVVSFGESGPWDDHPTVNDAIYAPLQFVEQFVIPGLKPFVH